MQTRVKDHFTPFSSLPNVMYVTTLHTSVHLLCWYVGMYTAHPLDDRAERQTADFNKHFILIDFLFVMAPWREKHLIDACQFTQSGRDALRNFPSFPNACVESSSIMFLTIWTIELKN